KYLEQRQLGAQEPQSPPVSPPPSPLPHSQETLTHSPPPSSPPPSYSRKPPTPPPPPIQPVSPGRPGIRVGERSQDLPPGLKPRTPDQDVTVPRLEPIDVLTPPDNYGPRPMAPPVPNSPPPVTADEGLVPGVDVYGIVLGILAVMSVLGLIPLWYFVIVTLAR
ncbi:MAG: hypothetical protein GYB68_17525, partial [Chloroflexi bacterium]|nr:hypothetical protein [Chloroflexota bacterium]